MVTTVPLFYTVPWAVAPDVGEGFCPRFKPPAPILWCGTGSRAFPQSTPPKAMVFHI